MSKFVSHFSAAKFWGVPYLDTVVDSIVIPAINGIEKSDEISEKEHYTFLSRREIIYRKGMISHLCELPLPVDAVLNCTSKFCTNNFHDFLINKSSQKKSKIKVASPELTFLQLAAKLDLHRLILLGLQLCAHPPGKPEQALSTKQKLLFFIGKMPKHRGIQNSRRALKYIENGSGSIMESLVYMILTLPHNLGGYAIKDAVFNYEIRLNKKLGQRLGQNRCFVDLYYKEAKLAVEYDSFAFQYDGHAVNLW